MSQRWSFQGLARFWWFARTPGQSQPRPVVPDFDDEWVDRFLWDRDSRDGSDDGRG
jgi:hypothetical protein